MNKINLWLQSYPIESYTGAQHGDQLASFLFALALSVLRRKIEELQKRPLNVWCCDCGILFGTYVEF